jgi:hypothetical protein
MAILDTFIILFKSLGTAQVVADEKKVEKAGDSLTRNLTATQEAFKGVGSELVNIGRNLAGVAAGVLSAAAIFQSLKASVEYTQDLSRTSKLLGVNIEELDAWGQAIIKAGGDAKTFQSSIHSLAEHLGSSPRVALQALLPLADAFAKLGRFRALQYGRKLGLDEPTILLLQRGRREVMALLDEQRRLGVVTKQQQQVTDEYTLSLQRSEQAFGTLSRTVATEALPVFSKFYDLVATPVAVYLTEHKDLISGAILAIGGAAAIATVQFLPWIAAITGVTLALGALALAYEDVKFYFEGKDSLLGTFIPPVDRNKKGALFTPFTYGAKEQVKTRSLLTDANNSPINTLTSNSISNASGDKNQTINISEIVVNTQSTDAEGIAAEFRKSLSNHFYQANNQFGNGVAY